MNDRYKVWERGTYGFVFLMGWADTEAKARAMADDLAGAAEITDELLGITLITDRATNVRKLERAVRVYRAAA